MDDLPEGSDVSAEVPEVPETPEATETPDGSSLDNVSQAQADQAVAALQGMEGVDPNAWGAMDAAGRLETLQNIENTMAGIQGRPAVEVSAEAMDASVFGGFNGQGISLNVDHLNSNMPVDEFVNTIVHEGRHAYQDYAIHNPGFHPDEAVTALWADNMNNYLTAEEYGQELYQGQPLEADAWRYADAITNRLISESNG